MADYQDGAIAEGPNGAYLVFKYGSWHPSDASGRPSAPIDASARWGSGARELPNGTIERVGPRGGVSTVATNAAGGEDGVGKLTEGQGKAMLYGGMMAGAERDYQAARENGYDPASFRNQAARVAGVVPFDGDFFGRLIRDDVSDAGNQAELRWAEGNLRQLTGAAATNPEIARVAAINFDRGNDELANQRYRSRSETYQGTRYAAGPGSAALPDYPNMPGRVGDADPETGLPSYPGIAAAASGISEIPAPEGGYGQPTDPNAPKPGDVRTYSQDLAPTDTPNSLSAQGYVYDAGSDTWRRERQQQAGGYDAALAQERANTEQRGRAGQGYGITDAITGPLNDEMAYAAGYIGQGAGNIARRLSGRDIEVSADERGRASRDVMMEQQEGFRRDHPVQNFVGNALGIAAGGAGAAPSMAGRMATGAGLGGAYGFAEADGSVTDRLPGAALGAGLGAVAVPAVERIVAPVIGGVAQAGVNALQTGARFAGRQAGRVGNALGVPGSEALLARAQPNALAQSVNRLAARAPQDVNALNVNAQRLRSEGIDPTFADVIDDGGRGVLRATNTRQTPARQASREFADNRAAGLQDRISTQARRTVSNDPRSPLEMTTEMTARRGRQADQAFGAVRGDMVSPDRGVLEALRTPAMRPAIEEAMTSALNRGDQETAGMLRNLTDDALEYGADAQITVGMADRIARALNGRAEAYQRAGNNDQAASHFALAERLRGSARGQSPGYDSALSQFADESGKIDAVALGEGFMSMEADQFAAAVAKLSPEERQVAQAAARRAIERQAGTQGQAPGVAQRLSGGREQTMRSQALLGDAEPMQRAMSAEREVLRNAQAINPSAGSQTSMNAQDAMNAAGMLGGARDVMTGNVGGVAARIANGIKSRGFSDREAEAIGLAAIDSGQTDTLINLLAQRMSRRDARNLARAMRHQVTTGLQSVQQN